MNHWSYVRSFFVFDSFLDMIMEGFNEQVKIQEGRVLTELDDEEFDRLVELGQQRAEQSNGSLARWLITASSAIAIGIIGVIAFV